MAIQPQPTGKNRSVTVCLARHSRRKGRQSRVVYVDGHDSVTRMDAKPQFKCSRPIDLEAMYEIELHKKLLKHDIPVQLGKLILDMAKIRMCQWVYNFVHRYLKPDTYKLIQMDTDSLYGHFDLDFDLERLKRDPCYCPLEQLVRDDMKEEFRESTVTVGTIGSQITDTFLDKSLLCSTRQIRPEDPLQAGGLWPLLDGLVAPKSWPANGSRKRHFYTPWAMQSRVDVCVPP